MKNIKKNRSKYGMSQAECALAIGVSRQILNSVELSPRACLNEEHAKKLSQLFECNIYDLVDIKAILPYEVTEADKIAIIKQILAL